MLCFLETPALRFALLPYYRRVAVFSQACSTEGVKEVLLQKHYISFVISIKWSGSIVINTQPAIACSKLTIETLEQGVKYVQS